jgi:putative PIG3 family NAD(P)H quinone oxidoreductase
MTDQLPAEMTVIEIREAGGPDVLVPARRALPEPGARQVLVKVAAAGVNRPDVLQRMGAYPPPPDASDIPGLEVAGEIIACGDKVRSHRAGDRITALVTGGGYAEYCLASEDLCLPWPEGFDAVQSAALPETFFDRCRLQEGETFLVHGGSSGIGTTAIQLAKAFGAKVFTTAGSADKCKVCEELGAGVAINYRDEDFVAIAKAETGKKGIDVILDMVGGDYIARNIRAAARDGRICNIAFLRGSKAEVDFLPVMLKRLTLTGSTLRARSDEFKAAIASNLKEKVWPLLETGTVKPVIHETFPMADAPKVHALMESNRHIGKIILTN